MRAALDKRLAERRAEHEQRHERFARELAQKLGISAEKVESVLGDLPRGAGRGFGRHG